MTLKNISFRNLKYKEYNNFRNYYKKNLDKKNIFVKSKKVFDYHFKNKKIYNFFITIFKKKFLSIQGYIPQSKYDYKLPNNEIFLSNFHAIQDKIPGIGRLAFTKLIKKKICRFNKLSDTNVRISQKTWFFYWENETLFFCLTLCE